MRVRMKVDVSGTRNGVLWPRRGEVVDLPDTEAMELCGARLAEPVAIPMRAERAVAPDPEVRADAAKPPRKAAKKAAKREW